MSEGRGRAALAEASKWRDDLVRFLRDMIAIQAESCGEKARCERVKAEYERLGFDEVRFDALGSVVARIGSGPFTVLMDGHIDCVGVGDPGAWAYDPFVGKLEDGKVFGRGAVDELPGIATAAYGMKILKDRGWPGDITVYLVASVMEEDCDGLPLMHLIEKEGVRPDVVVLGEPTNLDVYRGHRGRMEIEIVTKGRSVHGAHCERGVNAIYLMAPIVKDVEALNDRLRHDDFLGKGTVTVSYVDCKTPSYNAVPDECRIVLDRRLTTGESPELALEEIRALPSIGNAVVRVLPYDATSWRGLHVAQDKTYPTWVLPEAHYLVQGVAAAAEAVLGRAPALSRWTFSTNGVATAGRLGIPTVGFAPAREELAHTTDEHVLVDDLVLAAAAYALIPGRVQSARSWEEQETVRLTQAGH